MTREEEEEEEEEAVGTKFLGLRDVYHRGSFVGLGRPLLLLSPARSNLSMH